MISSPGPGRPESPAGPVEVLSTVRRAALVGADALLQHVPDTGDHTTGRAVDAFVEQAGDALRAVAEAVGETLQGVSDGGDVAAADVGPEPADARAGAAEMPPRGWHW